MMFVFMLPIFIGFALTACFVSTIIWYILKPEARKGVSIIQSSFMRWVVGLFLVGICLLLGNDFVEKSSSIFHIQLSGIEVHGKVLKIDKKHAVVEFKDEKGDKIQAVSPFSDATSLYEKGQKVEILYFPANPRCATINDFYHGWGTLLLLGSFITAFASVTVLFILLCRWERSSQAAGKR